MRNLIFLGSALALRVAVGLGSFLVMARALAPEQFGIVVLGATFGSLAGFLADMGSSVRTLRDLGAHAERANAILGPAVCAKLLLTVPFTVLAAPLAIILLGPEAGAAFLAGFAAFAITAVTDLVFVAFRALERNLEELKAAALTSAVIAATMSTGLIPGVSMLGVGLILLLSRLLSFWLTLEAARRLAGVNIAFSRLSLGQLRAHVSASWAWAISTNTAYLNSQLDGIMIAPLLGPGANGIYQSVSRFLGVTSQVSMLLISFWAPRIARSTAADGPQPAMERRGVLSVAGAGAVTGLGLTICGPLVTVWLLPPAYAETARLWPLMGLLAFSRSLAAGFALVLVARNRPRTRLVSEAAALGVNITGLLIAVPVFGLAAAPLALTAGALMTAIICAAAILMPPRLRRNRSETCSK
jgi:O-antigen/teichoic acid export membrane protein